MIKEKLNRYFLKENQLFVLALGLCPALAVGTTVLNAAGMGAAVVCVLVCSNAAISLLRKCIPPDGRLLCFLSVTTVFAAIAGAVMKGRFPALSDRLGMYVPLIAVNCAVLARAEAFASENGIFRSAVDGLLSGAGFCCALLFMAAAREFLGENAFLGRTIIPGFYPMHFFSTPTGAFFVLAAAAGFLNYRRLKREN
jgi:electron transport complex protein RnfE